MTASASKLMAAVFTAVLLAGIISISAFGADAAPAGDNQGQPAALSNLSLQPESVQPAPAGPDTVQPDEAVPETSQPVPAPEVVPPESTVPEKTGQPGAAPQAPAAAQGEGAAAAQGGGQLTAQEYFALGEESYESGDYQRAGDYYNKCLALNPDPTRQAKAHERLAFIYAAFGEQDKVYNEFVLSLSIDRGLTLDPEQVSPKIYEAFIKARGEVVREGILVVNSDPAGAEVQLDGQSLGEAPLRKEHLPEGDYVLRMVKPGYESSESPVTIKKDVTLTIDEKLVRARGTLTVSTVPPGAQTVFDGRGVGATPLDIDNVSGGTHTISFKSDYFEPFEAHVDMEKGEARTFSAELKRRLLVIAEDGGYGPAMQAVHEKLSAMSDISVVDATPAELQSRLIERGLDPKSIDFVLERKPALTLEDSAALSGVMEEDRVELALALTLGMKDGIYELGVALYSTASMSGDIETISGKDEAELVDKFGRFIDMWKDISGPGSPAVGLRLVDRAAGGVEVISVVPGMPAAGAGLLPGDIIKSVDGNTVAAKPDFERLMTAGPHELAYTRGSSSRTAKLTAAVSASETPPDSPDYLYNLALVEFKEYIDNIPAPAEDASNDERGLNALDLGNVYFRMGDYDKAVKAYTEARMTAKAGICTGTALYRAGQAYEKLGMWTEAADSYRKAMLLYPDATLGSADGEPVGPLARERLMWLYEAGLTKERWWL